MTTHNAAKYTEYLIHQQCCRSKPIHETRLIHEGADFFTGQRVETALHALAIGSMGTMMLAMMSRVSLGHTGRAIRTLPGIGVALAVLLIAALLRSIWLMLFPQSSHWVYSVVIIAWCLSYLVFVLHYAVPLWSARVDGEDG